MNLWKVSTLVLTVALGIVVGGPFVREAAADAQPHMEQALRHLKDAKAELKIAEPDKGGHREKALAATEHAITQVEKGIEFANKH